MILGITGSIGSGTTTAAKLFGKHNYKVIDADEIAHGLLKNDSKIYKKIADEFGKEILYENKDIDRKKLGEVAFNDDKKLKKLNSIMHPAIAKDIKNKISEIRDKCGNKTRIMIDAPLLLESGARGFVDKIIVVDADQEKFDFETYLYPRILEADAKMLAYESDEFMSDMGTPERLKKCEDFLKSK